MASIAGTVGHHHRDPSCCNRSKIAYIGHSPAFFSVHMLAGDRGMTGAEVSALHFFESLATGYPDVE